MKHMKVPSFGIVPSDIGPLFIERIRYGFSVRRSDNKSIGDAKKNYDGYLVTVGSTDDVNLAGIVGIGRKRATFFCDRPRTKTQTEVILSVLNFCFRGGKTHGA